MTSYTSTASIDYVHNAPAFDSPLPEVLTVSPSFDSAGNPESHYEYLGQVQESEIIMDIQLNDFIYDQHGAQ